jgi:hypothetical protein
MSVITWTQTPTLKQLTLPSGNTYWFKDDEVRQWIGDGSTSGAEKRLSDAESEISKLSNATHWLGITTTTLTDGSTTNPITINGNSVTAVSGDIVQDSNGQEYIFNGTSWQAFGGSIGSLKAFAYVDTGTVTITPKGSNASSSVSGTCAVTPSGSIGVGSGTANYTPAGSVSAPAITVESAGTTAKVTGITNVGSMPTYTVSNEVLTITAGSTPTADTEKTFKTGDASYSASAPTFSGTAVDLEFTGTSSSGTISGTAAAQTFTGTEESHTVNPAT